MKLTKRLKESRKLVVVDQSYKLDDAFAIIKKYEQAAKAKFNETVDVVFKLGVDPKDTNNTVRGAVAMPNGLGKNVRVAVIAKPERVAEAKAAGADLYGSDEFIDEIKAGKLDFDVCIATPDMMAAISKVGKILGPKGLMPNPKLGTVSDNITQAVKNAKSGQVEFKIDKAAIIHAGVGKIGFETAALKQNYIALYEAINSAKPASFKGIYIKGAFLTTTMGPSIRLDLASIVG